MTKETTREGRGVPVRVEIACSARRYPAKRVFAGDVGLVDGGSDMSALRRTQHVEILVCEYHRKS